MLKERNDGTNQATWSYNSLKIKQKLFKNNDYINMSNRGVKNYYLDNIKNPICCISSLNIQNIYNVIRKDLSL